jgi:hypothetical protein
MTTRDMIFYVALMITFAIVIGVGTYLISGRWPFLQIVPILSITFGVIFWNLKKRQNK